MDTWCELNYNLKLMKMMSGSMYKMNKSPNKCQSHLVLQRNKLLGAL